MRGLPSILSLFRNEFIIFLFFATSLINSIIQEHEAALTAAINDSDTAGMSLPARDKMPGLPSILSLFRNEFNKFNNTRARTCINCSN